MTKKGYSSRKNNEVKLRRVFDLIILLNIREGNHPDWGIIHLVTPLREILESLSLGKCIGNWTKAKIKNNPQDKKTMSFSRSWMLFQAFKNCFNLCSIFCECVSSFSQATEFVIFFNRMLGEKIFKNIDHK